MEQPTHGRPTPMAGTIFDIKRYAIHDGPGIRTTVFFKGCPLDCAWCHNPESMSPDPEPVAARRISGMCLGTSSTANMIGCEVSAETVMKEIMADEIFYEQSGGGVTFSGGEPMMQIDFLRILLKECRAAGIHTAVDTCGYAPSGDFESIRENVDLYLFDLKPMDSRRHQEHTGVSNDSILDNLKMLAEWAADIIIRIPLIPQVTATVENVDAVADFLGPLPQLRRIDLLPYNKLGEDKIRRYNLNRRSPAWGELPENDIAGLCQRLEARGFAVRVEG